MYIALSSSLSSLFSLLRVRVRVVKDDNDDAD